MFLMESTDVLPISNIKIVFTFHHKHVNCHERDFVYISITITMDLLL